VNNQPASPSLLKLVGTALLVLVPLIYGIIALNTGDVLWISPVFDAQPVAIFIHCFGTDVPLEVDSPSFVELTALVNQSLTGRKRWDDLSLSAITIQDYRSHPKMMTLELLYAAPFRVHSPYKFFSHIDTIIIPLVGRHAQTNAVFGLAQTTPAAGSFHIESTAPLVEYITSHGLCREP
jgi:hypothetical protein